jgi:hypothetical protein
MPVIGSSCEDVMRASAMLRKGNTPHIARVAPQGVHQLKGLGVGIHPELRFGCLKACGAARAWERGGGGVEGEREGDRGWGLQLRERP